MNSANPKASHGQDNVFLIKFLEELKIDDLNIGIWHITAEEGKADLL